MALRWQPATKAHQYVYNRPQTLRVKVLNKTAPRTYTGPDHASLKRYIIIERLEHN